MVMFMFMFMCVCVFLFMCVCGEWVWMMHGYVWMVHVWKAWAGHGVRVPWVYNVCAEVHVVGRAL